MEWAPRNLNQNKRSKVISVKFVSTKPLVGVGGGGEGVDAPPVSPQQVPLQRQVDPVPARPA